MDQRTGKIYEAENMKSLMELMRGDDPHNRTDKELEDDLIPIKYDPDPNCRKCHGRGSVRRGIQSNRFKPCKCTQEAADE